MYTLKPNTVRVSRLNRGALCGLRSRQKRQLDTQTTSRGVYIGVRHIGSLEYILTCSTREFRQVVVLLNFKEVVDKLTSERDTVCSEISSQML